MDYTKLAPTDIVEKTSEALKAHGIQVQRVSTKAEALEAVRNLIPVDSELTTGGSTTLDQIGFTDLLKSGNHPWKNLKDAIVKETDPEKQAKLRQCSVHADYFLGSVHAVTESGQLLDASNTGSQIPAYAFTSPNVIWVVGTQKIVPTLDDGLKRLHEHVLPLEDERMMKVGNVHTQISMWWVFEKLSPFIKRNLHLIFVDEMLGF